MACNLVRKSSFSEDLVFRVYELAKNGNKLNDIAQICGISPPTLIKWKKQYPVLKKALIKGRKLWESGNGTISFMDYVHDKLPRDVRKTWNKICILEEKGSSLERVRAFIESKPETMQKYLFVHAMVSSNFHKAKACRKIGLSHAKLLRWSKDGDFVTLMEFLRELRGDYFEDHLTTLIEDGDARAIIFANKTFNKKRGYGTTVDINVDSNINHSHTISIEDVGMSLEERKKLLDTIRTKRIESNVVDVETKRLGAGT